MNSLIKRKSLVPVLLLSGSLMAMGKGVGLLSTGTTQAGITQKSGFNPVIMEDHLDENFESGMPAGWTLETNPGSPGWQVGDTYEAGQSDYMTFPDHTDFAYCNSDDEGDNVTFNDWMISPSFDIPDADFIYLEFASFFRNQPDSEWDNWGEVSIRIGGGAWTQIAEMEATAGNDFELLSLNLSEYGGENDVQVGWHFWDNGNWAFGWGVDDVLLFSATGDVFPPEIETLPIYNHLNPPDPIDISATITDDSYILSATLNYCVNWGDWQELAMVNPSGDIWEGTIPSQNPGANVDYYISAVDLSENANEGVTPEFTMIVNSVGWLHRDDGTTENGVGGNDAWYGAVSYSPAYLPLTINMIELFMHYEETLEFHIWSLDQDGLPAEDLIDPFEADVMEGVPSVISLPEPLSVDEPFAVGFYSAESGNYCGLDETGYFFENCTIVNLGDDWAPLSQYGYAGNYYIRAFVNYQSEGIAPEVDRLNGIELAANYPNPFNPYTTIEFTLMQPAMVQLSIFDVIGNEMATLVEGHRTSGSHTVVWNAADYPSGVYFYRLVSGDQSISRKMVLVK